MDNQATIELIKTNKITSRSRHLDIPIAFAHDQFILVYYTIEHILTKLNTADLSIKATTGPFYQRHWKFLFNFI